MKIGLVCPYNMSRGGAVIEIVKDMRAGLISRGHEVKIITGRPKNTSAIGVPPEDLVFVGRVADFKSPTHTLASFTMSSAGETLAQKIQDEQFDVLHLHEPAVPFLGKQLLNITDGAVRVATFHAKLPDTPVSNSIGRAVVPYLRSILGDLDELVIGSSAAGDYLRTFTNRELHYIPNGVDLKTYQPVLRKAPGARKKIFYVGRLEHRKGVKYLIKAFAELARQRDDVDLVVAGSGPDHAKLELLATTLGISSRVTFLGFIDNDTKLRLFAEADLFCSPAIFGESFGLVLLEAMATGLVTVAGDNEGYSAVMQGRGALSLVTPQDTADFARRLELLLDNEDLRKLWRNWAHAYVQQFDYEDIIDQYENLYKAALAQRRRHIKRQVAVSPP